MSSFDKHCFLLLLLLTSNALAGEGYILGGGLEADTEDGLALSAIGDFGLAEDTRVSGAIARNMADLQFRPDIDTWYADVGLDHWWDPVGIRLGLAYWGDNDTLDSTDVRTSLYWRGEGFRIAGDYEFRDFSFLLPATDQFPGRTIGFDANGIGVTARFDITDTVTFGLSGMDYDYSVNLRLADNRRLLDLLSFSRLSLINSLIDYRAYATLGMDVGKRRWQLDVGTWKGEADGGTTQSATVRYLSPLSETADLEFALGADDSDLYGTVTFFSVFLYFYGGI